jgi:hypothetical protein
VVGPNCCCGWVLSSTTGPFKLQLTTTGGMPAMFSATYFQGTSAGGSVLIGGGQQTITNYRASTQSNRMMLETATSRFVDQTIVYEHGAVLVVQADGAAMAVPPAMHVSKSSSLVAIDLTLPTLISSPQGAPSSATAAVTLVGGGQQFMLSTGPSVTFGVGTKHADAWKTFWRSAFQAAGLSEALGHFSVGSDANAAWFTMEGTATGPGHDVSFVLHQGSVAVAI